MGHWGIRPSENDSAADWLDAFAERTGIERQLSRALDLPLDEIDKVRAATNVLLSVSDTGLLNHESLQDLAFRGVVRLSEALESECFTNGEIRTIVEREMVALRSLLASTGTLGAEPDDLEGAIRRIAVEEFRMHLYHVVDIDGVTAELISKDLVGTGFLDEHGVMHLRFDDGREDGFCMTCRCIPADTSND